MIVKDYLSNIITDSVKLVPDPVRFGPLRPDPVRFGK